MIYSLLEKVVNKLQTELPEDLCTNPQEQVFTGEINNASSLPQSALIPGDLNLKSKFRTEKPESSLQTFREWQTVGASKKKGPYKLLFGPDPQEISLGSNIRGSLPANTFTYKTSDNSLTLKEPPQEGEKLSFSYSSYLEKRQEKFEAQFYISMKAAPELLSAYSNIVMAILLSPAEDLLSSASKASFKAAYPYAVEMNYEALSLIAYESINLDQARMKMSVKGTSLIYRGSSSGDIIKEIDLKHSIEQDSVF